MGSRGILCERWYWLEVMTLMLLTYCVSDDVVADFTERIKHYELQYETIDELAEPDYSFIKVRCPCLVLIAIGNYTQWWYDDVKVK